MISSFPLAFGAMQVGGRADPVESRAMLDRCFDAGIRHFDTAWVYTEGRSEQILGQFARQRAVSIASKIGYTGGAGKANLLRQFDETRRRLARNRIDLLYLHRFDPMTPLEETLALFAEWQVKGLIGQIGVSNFAAWQVMKAQAVAAQFGTRIDAIQPMYSVVKRQAEVEILPMARDQRMTVYSYSPLGGGLLTGKYDPSGPSAPGTGRLTEDKRYAARYAPEFMAKAALGLSALAQDLGVHPVTLAVSWVMAHPTRPVPLISARSSDQLGPSLAAARFTMPRDLYDQISQLSPKPAPADDRIEET